VSHEALLDYYTNNMVTNLMAPLTLITTRHFYPPNNPVLVDENINQGFYADDFQFEECE